MPFTINGEVPALEPGSSILVTGANSYLGSHICAALLERGYRVVGTVRNAKRDAWMLELFNQKDNNDSDSSGSGSALLFELAEVRDLNEPGVFERLLSTTRAAGVVHVATKTVSSSDKPEDIVWPSMRAATAILRAAIAAAGSVRRFVATSSIAAIDLPRASARVPKTVTSRDWNVYAVAKAWESQVKEDDDEGEEKKEEKETTGMPKKQLLMHAGKVLTEAALWETMRDSELTSGMVLNTVCPFSNFGPVLSPLGATASALMLRRAWERRDLAELRPAAVGGYKFFVDVRDTARLHVSALLDRSVQGERLIASSGPYNGWIVKEAFEKIQREIDGHDRNFGDPVPGDFYAIDSIDTARETELLKRLGRHGWIDLDTSIRGTIFDLQS